MTEPPLKLPTRDADSHKGDYGRVLLVGGSRGMAGAIALSSMAALRTGSGLVSALVPDRCLETVAGFHPGIMTIPGQDDHDGRFFGDAVNQASRVSRKVDAVGCGPGMTTQQGSHRIVERLLHCRTPLVLDADAINILAETDYDQECEFRSEPFVLTPHPGEFARLSGIAANQRSQQMDAASDLASRCGCVIVLKGSETFVTNGDDRWTCAAGNPGMATGGSGDVLTGVITSLLGQALPAWDAARLGVWIHGRAGNLAANQVGMAGLTCQEILDAIPRAVDDASDTKTSKIEQPSEHR